MMMVMIMMDDHHTDKKRINEPHRIAKPPESLDTSYDELKVFQIHGYELRHSIVGQLWVSVRLS
jgi:hypothetical protein